VLAHGAGGNAMSWWQQIPYFAKRYTVVTFDHRSFGRSTCPPEAFHPRFFADDLIRILDALGIERTPVVCQSMGGWTGLRTALHYPERVSCLVLGDTPGGLFDEQILGSLVKIGDRTRGEGLASATALAPDFPVRNPELAFLYDQINQLNTEVDLAALPRLFDEEARILPEALSGFSIPTLVLIGEHDLLFPPDLLRHVVELIPGAQTCEFPSVGHSTYFEDPTTFNRRVDAFISENQGPAHS
jgi:pimeloyl-ACP methyl ester carboxylesterase